VSKCYSVNNERHCFYTSDTSGSVLRWNEAREFCVRRNSTLPIITDENIDDVFQRFIEKDSNSVTQNSYVWIDARRVNDVKWHWIDGRSSSKLTDCDDYFNIFNLCDAFCLYSVFREKHLLAFSSVSPRGNTGGILESSSRIMWLKNFHQSIYFGEFWNSWNNLLSSHEDIKYQTG